MSASSPTSARCSTSLPPGLRLVLLTRRDPPLRLSRLRLAGEVTEIRADELAFTAEETERLLAPSAAALTSHDVQRLWRRTEGWVAALRLAELTLRDHPHPDEFVAAFTGDDASVADYILSEVLGRFPAGVRRFLLETSPTEATCGGLADAMTDGTGGAAMLRRLARDNAMVAPVEASPGWFRYHPLLRDLLRVELRYERGRDLRPLDRRAAGWLAEHGDLLAAIRFALRAEDWDLAGRILADGWVDLLLFGDVAPVRALAARLGEPLLERWPELHVALAAAHLEAGDAPGAQAALARARAHAGAVRPERAEIFDLALRTVALQSRLRDGSLELVSEAAPVSAAGATVPPRPALRALARASAGAIRLWRGELDAAELELESAVVAAQSDDAAYVAAFATAHLAIHALLTGAYERADEHAASAIAALELSDRLRTPAAAAAYAVRAELELVREDLELSKRSLEWAELALGSGPDPSLHAFVLAIRVDLLAALGQNESALQTLHFGRTQAPGAMQPRLEQALGPFEVRLLHDVGEHERAEQRMASLLAGNTSLDALAALARLRLAEGEPEAALNAVACAPEAVDRHNLRARVNLLGLEALADDALGDRAGAAAALERALRLAEPAGLRRPLVALGGGLRPLLHRQIRGGTAHRTLIDDLLTALDRPRHARGARSELVEPLSDRELAVLRYLPTLMSNQDIGGELFISINTVKTHLRQIYRKLDVNTRRGAVDRARELHLLGPATGSERPAGVV